MTSFFSPASSAGQDQAAFKGALLQTQLAGQAQGTLTDAINKGLGFIDTGYGAGRNALTSNFDPALSALTSGYGAAANDITTNYGLGQGQIQQGINAYAPWVQPGIAANNTIAGALGQGTPDQVAAARGSFTASPQYQWNLDQSTGNTIRAANKYGMTTGGNTIDAITRLGSNLASGEFNNWLTNLGTVANRGFSATSGQAGLLGQSAGLYGQQGSALGTLDAARGTGTAGLYSALGSGLAGSYQGQAGLQAGLEQGLGQGVAGLQTGLGSSLAGAYKTAADADAAAQAANTKFQSGLIGGALGLGSSLLTGGMTGGLSGLAGLSGLGGLGSSLSSSGAGLFSGLGFNPLGATGGFRGA